jgi:hypothetical protein
MKVRVARELVEGRYQVVFQVGEFTSEEVKKMSQFGTPKITLTTTQNAQNMKFSAPITQIPQLVAAFSREEEAKQYEGEVIQQLKRAIDGIRVLQDKFTSIEEIAL